MNSVVLQSVINFFRMHVAIIVVGLGNSYTWINYGQDSGPSFTVNMDLNRQVCVWP